MSARFVARSDAINFTSPVLGFFRFRSERRDDGMERPHPIESSVPPAHRFGPGECARDLRYNFGDHVDCRTAWPVDDRDVEIALLVRLDFGFLDRLESRGFQKTGNGILGRADARTLLLFLDVRL